jgi:hypothetical protein
LPFGHWSGTAAEKLVLLLFDSTRKSIRFCYFLLINDPTVLIPFNHCLV